MHGNLRHSLSVPSFHLIYLEYNSGSRFPQYRMPILPVVDCRQADDVERFGTGSLVLARNRTPGCISRDRW